tara:strand:- start:898 stop:1074 length:177 start_codon:yes stop_codon:yes gene_type:complete
MDQKIILKIFIFEKFSTISKLQATRVKWLKCEEFEQNCVKSHKYEMMKDDEKDKVSTN